MMYLHVYVRVHMCVFVCLPVCQSSRTKQEQAFAIYFYRELQMYLS